MSTPTTTTTTEMTPNYPCAVDDSTKQYCYTLPKLRPGSSYQTHDADKRNHFDADFNAGNTIRFSKVCSRDSWYSPYKNSDDSCDKIRRYECRAPLSVLLSIAVPTPNGYVTLLNCPICGCTPGANDVMQLRRKDRKKIGNSHKVLSQT